MYVFTIVELLTIQWFLHREPLELKGTFFLFQNVGIIEDKPMVKKAYNEKFIICIGFNSIC